MCGCNASHTIVIQKRNRSAKGKLWSAIPVALLCLLVVKRRERQGSGSEGDKALKNTGDFCSSVCPSVRPSQALSGLKSALSGMQKIKSIVQCVSELWPFKV